MNKIGVNAYVFMRCFLAFLRRSAVAARDIVISGTVCERRCETMCITAVSTSERQPEETTASIAASRQRPRIWVLIDQRHTLMHALMCTIQQQQEQKK